MRAPQPRAPEDYQLLRVYAISGAYCWPAPTLDAREIFIFGGCVAQSAARAGHHGAHDEVLLLIGRVLTAGNGAFPALPRNCPAAPYTGLMSVSYGVNALAPLLMSRTEDP